MSTVGNTALLPYGVTPQAPAITIPNVAEFKNDRSRNAEKYFHSEIEQLNEKYKHLVQLANDCELVYSATYNFVPKVGHMYHLYWTGIDYTLSMIDNWDRYQCVGTFVLTSDNIWKRL
jgi:hypothetical protein